MIEYEDYKSRILGIKPDLENLGEALKLDEARDEIVKLEKESAGEGFWSDLEKSQKVLQKIKQLKHKCEKYDRLVSRWEDMLTLCTMAIEENDETLLPELSEEFSQFSGALEEARLSTLLSGEYDSCNVIINFHAGAGGTEAQDWTGMLYRMYTRWAERHDCKCTVLDYIGGEEAGIKSAALSIEGENVYGFLKSENGIHRLVRVSPFDAMGRRHTSFAAIEVMPDIDDDTTIEIRPEDIEMQVYRSSGAGGQHVNKTSSAVRLIHIPTGVIVACQTERSQHQNREYAMRMLRSKLLEIKEREHLDKIEDIKGEQMKIQWGSQIRSYVFMPYTLVKDHRTGFENGNINAVMDGDIDGFINAYLTQKAGE
ncbi:MAG: peptide chain release factor 2 [Oscillospiraceae bacterium]|nr:peptide chain release factor 2 [Oscillospiraceae bacterium]